MHLLLALVCCSVCFPARAQGVFRNLGFESAVIAPVPGDPYNRIEFASAFPGWTGYVGGVPEDLALYNNISLGSSVIGLDGPVLGPGEVSPTIISGSYTALLQAGLRLFSSEQADTTLSQTSLVPVGAVSLLFDAQLYYGSFAVTLGGQPLLLVALGAGPDSSTLYGADIHGWAGKSAELAFTVYSQILLTGRTTDLYLDSISFSPQSVPEPSIIVLGGFGLSLLWWQVRRRS